MSRVKSLPRSLLVGSLLLVVAWQWGQSLWLLGKAHLARGLIAHAWHETLARPGSINKPWPWADTWPVLSLAFPGYDSQFLVLHGSTGNVLAFAPGLMPESRQPGEGPVLIAGHRDTHFSFIGKLQPGDRITVATPEGSSVSYEVKKLIVLDVSEDSLYVEPGNNELLLVTCYPFGVMSGDATQRYVVRAASISEVPGTGS